MAALLLTIATARAEPVADRVADPAHYIWRSRVLMVFAPSESDPNLAAQRAVFDRHTAGMTDRDLVLLTSIGGPASPDHALRKRYGVSGDGFEALLIGKDGGVKLTSTRPFSAQELFQTVDAMPMRRREAERK